MADAEMERIVAILTRAGTYALEQQERMMKGEHGSKITAGTDREFVEEKTAFSKVDTDVQEMVLRDLHKLYSHAGVATEEAGDLRMFAHVNEFREGKETIILDPIDGSHNYLRKKPLWGISFALARGTDLTLGAIRYPALGITLTTRKGKGTRLNGDKVLLKSGAYTASDAVRVGGTVKGADEIRRKFSQTWSARSYVGTFLGMLSASSDRFKGVELPLWKAYIGRDTILYDLGCGPLAWMEAGGAVLGLDGKPTNPLAFWKRMPNGVIIAKEFIMSPTAEYGKAIIDALNA
jgi:myo-inositol-1(or 4)-monophosphatase